MLAGLAASCLTLTQELKDTMAEAINKNTGCFIHVILRKNQNRKIIKIPEE
jgi:hypothetical protein